ncbi:mechanosensitive ion channel family protein [Terriglobus aquaticus]|uniref:Mechanosensitive ion channel family protein n=1 Tax=Terriglobus aquaticus TaxID=940139 RepID=A0ABW9KGF4_9BACT|nr:mechanosensitive ion channel family protein [Terriglobus aquaticus]
MNHDWVQFVGPSHNLQIYGVKLLGVDAQNGRKLLFSIVFLLLLWVIRGVLQAAAKAMRSRESRIAVFWTGQGVSLVTFALGLLGLMSIWFDNPARLATGVGLVGAGLAFALQKVITSFAAYFIILRGNTFNVGDRIALGGVRGDVISLSFFQTVIMEMGEPPSMQSAKPDVWVQSRQFSGRIVTVSNSTLFDAPVFNYTRDFPFLWEEMQLPISYKDNRAAAEQILLEAAQAETVEISTLAAPQLEHLRQKFLLEAIDLKPRVYWRLTDNWVELTVRFLVKDHDIRGLKDRMSRRVIAEMDKAGIGIASGTYEIVGMPPLEVKMEAPAGVSGRS